MSSVTLRGLKPKSAAGESARVLAPVSAPTPIINYYRYYSRDTREAPLENHRTTRYIIANATNTFTTSDAIAGGQGTEARAGPALDARAAIAARWPSRPPSCAASGARRRPRCRPVQTGPSPPSDGASGTSTPSGTWTRRRTNVFLRSARRWARFCHMENRTASLVPTPSATTRPRSADCGFSSQPPSAVTVQKDLPTADPSRRWRPPTSPQSSRRRC